jgi:restriction system protein
MTKYSIDEFEKIGQGHRVDIFVVEILKYLKENSGKSDRKELIQYFIEEDDIVPSEWITKEFPGKNGTYKKFDFDFNFAKKELQVSGFLKDIRNVLELSEKGYDLDFQKFNLEQDVKNISAKYWQDKHDIRIAMKKKSKQIEQGPEKETVISEITTDNWREKLSKALHQMSPKKFESFARLLVKNMGVNIDNSKGVQVSNDGGIDGFGYMRADDFRTNRVGIQAKRWQGNIGRVEIQNFVGALSMNSNQAEYGIFITTSYFNKNAIEAARDSTIPITLINIDDICDLVAKYEIFVKPVLTYELDDYYFQD